MYFYLSCPFLGFFVLIHITGFWIFFCSTGAIIGTTIQLGEFFNWGKRFSFCIVILTECYRCTSVYDNRTESINPQNTMWCHPSPVENLWRRHHQCASSTKAEPSLLPSTTRASSRWKAQAVYTGVTFPPRHRRCPDHWAIGRRCQLPRLKRGKPLRLARRATAAAAAPAAAGCSSRRPDSCGRPCGRPCCPDSCGRPCGRPCWSCG